MEDKVRTVESVVGLLIEELRSVKRDNELLRDEITSVRSQHQQTEAHVLRIAETYQSAPVRAHSSRGECASSSSWSSAVWVPPSSPTFGHNTGANGDPNTPEAQALLTRLVPFVAKYDVKARNAPFVLDDLNKPWAAFRVHEPKTVAEMVPPILSYANPGFCALLRYRLDELLGCGLNNIVRVDMETIFTILPSLFPQRKAFAIGDPFKASFTWITKDKQAVNARTRNQYFFSKDGYAKWRITVVDGLVEDSPRFVPLSMPEVYRYLGTWMSDAQHQQQQHDLDSPPSPPSPSWVSSSSSCSSSSSSSPTQATLAATGPDSPEPYLLHHSLLLPEDPSAGSPLGRPSPLPISAQPSPSTDLLEEWLGVCYASNSL